MAATRYVCMHGHFYQPPRENPWLESIEDQESAAPYPNWNQRILAECYRPNAASRIFDGEGRIARITNNYSKISFNFGPTLMSWLQLHAADVYQGLIEADHLSRERYRGHGSAMAQAYNHLIMPLANTRDKRTQVIWGIRDFEHHFGRRPEGMWLPETAVDLETLDIMAEHGILFTVLAPGQARRIRRIGGKGGKDGEWQDVGGARIDPGRTYRLTTPSGRHIDLFFYDGGISSAVAFERLLTNGERFADRLLSRPPGPEPLLLHIATDGETYGHHHRHGDMALAYALQRLEQIPDVQLTNYAEFRTLQPATYEVEIFERSAWSCAHGVGRWEMDCGCHTGATPDWNQRWRQPLRESLDWLRDELITLFEEHGPTLLADPWAARDDYITAVNDRGTATVDRFLQQHGAGTLDQRAACKALQILEMQRNAMLMYTSCGWFFDDPAGVETIQILRYAARAVELAELVAGQRLEAGFLSRLEHVQSNRPEEGNGRDIYDRHVRPAKVDLRRIIAHYAVSTLLESGHTSSRVYCYEVEPLDMRVRQTGKAKLAIGTVRSTSTITRATSTMSFGALHLGDHNLTGGVRNFAGQEAYQQMMRDVSDAFERADMVNVQRQLDRHFLELSFSLKSLLRDHQDRFLRWILQGPLADAEAAYGQLYAHHAPLMRFLASLDLPLPDAFQTAARFVLDLRLRLALEKSVPDLAAIRDGFAQAKAVGVKLDVERLGYLWEQSLDRIIERMAENPDDLPTLETLTNLAELIESLKFRVDLWHAQNECYRLLQVHNREKRHQAYDGNQDSERWIELFARLCRAVRIAI